MKVFIVFILFAILAQGVDIKGERASEWVKRGFWSYQKGDFKEAISSFKKGLELKPDFSDAWYWYGNSLFRYGLIDMANEAWKNYLRLWPDPYIKHKLYGEKRNNEYTHLFTIKGDIKDEGRFFSPCGIYIDRADNLYVAGFGNDVVLKFSPFGRRLLKITDKALKEPYGVCVDRDGNIYVTSYSNNCVLKFSQTGKPLLRFGKKGIKDGEFIGCKGIEVDKSGYIYVVDSKRLQRFSSKGKFISKIDNLDFPNNICLDNGYIFVSDASSIKKFDSSFNYISSIALPKRPKWVSIYNNNLYITTGDGVFIYSKERGLIGKIKIEDAMGLSLNRFGLIYISSPESSNIYTFSNIPPPSLLVNRIDLANYPMVLFSLTLKADKYDIPGLYKNNFRVLEENRAAYPLGVEEIKENKSFIFVIEDSKYIKPEVKGLLSSCINQLKGGFEGAGVISFSKKDNLLLDFTLNKTRIRDAIESLTFNSPVVKGDAFLSALNKGIDASVSLLSKRAIIVITSIRAKMTNEMERLINYAKNNNIPVFIIDYKIEKDEVLQRLSRETNGEYLLARNSKPLYNFYTFLTDCLSNQTQYILYYRSPNAELKWSNEWTRAIIEAGFGKFGLKERVSYLIPPWGGARSSLGRVLIENKLYLEKGLKIKEYKKKREEERKKIKEMLAAEKAKHEVAPKEEKKGEKEEEKGHGGGH